MKTFISNLRTVLLAGLLCGSASPPATAGPIDNLPPLTTVSGSPRLPGKFVWADLVTDDLAGAQKFYSGLFGWTFRDYDGYLVAANDERPLCGMFQRPKPSDPAKKPRWIGYISVPSVGRVAQTVTNAGGRILASAQKLPNRGEQATFADPEGALFGVVRSSAGDPQDFLADPGDWIWIQLMSRDARKAAEFYRSVAGYDILENTNSARASDYILAAEGYARATVRGLPADAADIRPTWLLFVRVKSVPDSIARAKELGGKTLLEPRPELFGGKLAVVGDPSGAAVGIMEWSGQPSKGAP
ncbi:MAG: VOC family protein [Verrucomicrobiota bacterium]